MLSILKLPMAVSTLVAVAFGVAIGYWDLGVVWYYVAMFTLSLVMGGLLTWKAWDDGQVPPGDRDGGPL